MFHALIGWYNGVIIGAMVAAYLVTRMRKIFLYYLSGILILISGILFVANSENFKSIISGRYIGGIGHGIAFPTVLIHAAEMTPKDIRGLVLSSMNVWLTTSAFLASLIYALNFDVFKNYAMLDILFGVVIIVFGVSVLITAKLLTNESPYYLVSKNEDQEALVTLMKLRNEERMNWYTHQDYIEIKETINAELRDTKSFFNTTNMSALLKILLLRLLFMMSTCVCVHQIFFKFSKVISFEFGIVAQTFSRLISGGIFCFFVDRIGRRKLLLVSVTSTAAISLVIASISLCEGVYSAGSIAIAVFCVFYQLAFGVGLGNVSTTYMAECFPLKFKQYALLVIIILETLLQLLMMTLNWSFVVNISAYFYSLAALQILIGSYLYVVLPETRYLSLRECVNLINNKIN